ncbi:MAG: hypothetical protein KDH94_00240, partial [Coxiellaceae bacterium]|nr:hypothetical protein [Coxiellaceae bacterium]
KDYSGREFKKISPLQFAAWAYDIEMCELLLKNMDSKIALEQINLLEKSPEKYSPYGAHFDLHSLLETMVPGGELAATPIIEDNDHYWQKIIGGEQRKLPAHLIWRFCQQGENWRKKNIPIGFERQYTKRHIHWWFTHTHNDGSGVGSTWAAERGSYADSIRASSNVVSDHESVGIDARPGYIIVWHDEAVFRLLSRTLKERLDTIKDRLAEHFEGENNKQSFSL